MPEKNLNRVDQRRQYARDYYYNNRERLAAYHREYCRKFRKSTSSAEEVLKYQRPEYYDTYNVCDIMRANPERAASMVNEVISGERDFVFF